MLRRSETTLVLYFLYTSILALTLPLKWPIPVVTVSLNVVVIAGFFLLARAHSLRGRELLGIMRDWFPVPLMLLAYRQMGWFAQPERRLDLEILWAGWDTLLLINYGLRAAIESLGPLIPSLLEISYSLVYAIAPFSIAMLYVNNKRERVTSFVFTFLLGILLSYALFPYFPSEPPRTVFPGRDFPTVMTVFREFNWWLLGGYGIHTSVFPSAHVSGAFGGAFGMIRLLPEKRWVGRSLLVLAILIATATVYGRYHYAADAAAGFAVSVAAALISAAFEKREKAAERAQTAQTARSGR